MPRDISGNYTLPAGNPVVDGTIIDVNWANPTMDDIAVQLNNVITRDGVLGATQPIKFASGSAAAPSITFTADPALGIYRIGTNILGFATAGTERMRIAADGAVSIIGATHLTGLLTSVVADEGYRIRSDTAYLSGFNAAGSTRTGYLQFNAASTSRLAVDIAQALALNTAGTDRVTIAANGDVGIGLTPVYRLDVGNVGTSVQAAVRAGAALSAILSLAGNNTTPGASSFDLQQATDNSVDIVQRSNARMSFYTNASERVRITPSGDVGVGTATPNKLTVERALTVNAANNAALEVASGDVSRGWLFGNNARFTVEANGLPLTLNTGGLARLNIDTAGVITDGAGLELGYKDIPVIPNTGAFAFAAAHRGKAINQTDAASPTINSLAAGTVIVIINNNAAGMTILAGGGMTVRLAGTTLTGNRTLAPFGVATIYWVGTTTVWISGSGVS